ncbi:IPTL-CTERM sorting domain-containing protein [Halomonas denitrificans]|nr:IPTL-CTERM sorting domain-containing protein [Halomonas denitrificans]
MRISHNKALLAASICAALAGTSAQAATFNVTTNADAGPGSLRQALADANANMEADTIEMSAISGQTITLSSGQLVTSTGPDSITIDGAGVTIDAAGGSRVMYGYYTDLTLNDLTLTGGVVTGGGGGLADAGGGLLLYLGTLSMDNCTVSGNTAVIGGGVTALTLGDIDVSNSSISGNTAAQDVGGVYLIGYGNITVSDATISGNSAGTAPRGAAPLLADRAASSDFTMPFETRMLQRGGGGSLGGGLIAGYDVTVERSTISGNSATSVAGGLFLQGGASSLIDSTVSGNSAGGFAGGVVLYSQKYDALMSNSTIVGNAAGDLGGGAYIAAYGSSTVQFSTITGNSSATSGGGFFYLQYGTGMQHDATIVSGNTAASEPDVAMDPAATINAEFSLVGVAPTNGTLNADAATVALLGLDPDLEPLADNGGPTQSRLPEAGSPVIDAVPNGSAGCGGAVTTDQRGEARPFGSGCDIGSVEAGIFGVTGLPVPTLDRIGLLLMSGLLGIAAFFGFRSRSRREC